MNNPHHGVESMSPERRALLTIKRLQFELEAAKGERTGPIAIIGMSCRFPGGANSPEAFWQLLVEGRDAVREVPPERYNIDEFYAPDVDAPGKTVSRWGGFLDAIDQFDPAFFGISPREATYLDPQQRLLLEVSWEAMERAGLLPEKLFGSQTGVFIGLFNRDYFDMQLEQMVNDHATSANPYTGIGNGPSFAAGRLSYLLGLQGPSMVVDTVCSSSLVAMHLACQSLRNNECTVAFAGATNLILYPLSTIITSKMRALSPEGHCKTFDASADGFVRGEGCGVVILKRLSQALADGDPILAVVRGSAVNQDGRSNGLTAPNGLAQQAVIRQALHNARLAPEQISYVETHGTGTVLGDPIEVEALKAVLGQPRPAGQECVLGSVKTNVGHLESCAGMAGLIKTVLCLQHGIIPPLLHLKTLNPHISLEHTPFVLPTSVRSWPEGVERRYAGVSGAGLSGTNAHVVLEEAPNIPGKRNDTAPTEANHTVYLLPLSARTPEALRQLAHVYQRELVNAESALSTATLQNICYTASLRRTHYACRGAVVGQSHEELAALLETFAEKEQVSGASSEVRSESLPGPVFMFAGQGTQWAGMGRQLFEQEPVFRSVIEACEDVLNGYVSWSLLAELQANERHSRLHETAIAQVALFAIQVALVALWRSWGIVPGAVVGHSVGEIAAAYSAGVLPLNDAMHVVVQRGRLMQQAHGLGKMAAVEFSEAEARLLLSDYRGRLSIGAINSPKSIVLSGEAEALEEVLRVVEREGMFFRRLQVDYAFHSAQMEPFYEPLVGELQALRPQRASIELVSTVTGHRSSGEEYDAEYWGRNMCQGVRFGPAIEELIAKGYRTFLEISPQPALARPTWQCLEHAGKNGLVLPSLRQGMAERSAMLASLGVLYSQGYAVKWDQLFPESAGPYVVVPCPTYQWQRKRYWLSEKKASFLRSRVSSGKPLLHPLLEQRVRAATRETIFETRLNTEALSWLQDHRVYGTVVFPASAYVEMMLAAARLAFKQEDVELNDLFLHQALALPADGGRLLQVILRPASEAGGMAVQVFSCTEDDEGNEDRWVLHAEGTIHAGLTQKPLQTASLVLTDIRSRCLEVRESEQHYQHMSGVGLHYGAGFQGVRHIWRRDGEALALIRLPEQLEEEAGQYYMHPAQLDACFQAVEASLAKTSDEDEADVFLPVSMDSVRLYVRPSQSLLCHVEVHPQQEETDAMLVVDVQVLDEDGQPIATVKGLHLRRAPREALLPHAQSAHDWFYTISWERRPREVYTASSVVRPGVKEGSWLIFCDGGSVGTALAERLQAQGEQCVLVFAGRDTAMQKPGHYSIDPSNPAEFHRLVAEQFAEQHPCRGILHLWGLDAVETVRATIADLETSQQRICGSLLYIVQAVAQAQWSYFPQLFIITRGSQPVTGKERDLAIAQMPVWGLGRVIAMEQPDFHCKRIDLDPATDPALMEEALLQELLHPDSEDQIAFRSSESYVARLVRSVKKPRSKQWQDSTSSFHPDGTYLITGGLGGLGLAMARWMVERGGAKNLVLSSRSGSSDAARSAIDDIERMGARVLVVQADVSREDQVASMLQTVRSTMPPLRGIIHAAGVLDDGILLQQNWERFNRVMAPKLNGSWNLHVFTLDTPLDFFVLFSSGASLLGSAGQGNYAAANAFMDALAHYRRSRGLPAVSINWGAWAGVGMATTSAAVERRLTKDGMQPISLTQGMEVLEQLLPQSPAQIGVLPIDWSKFAKPFAIGERPPFLLRLLEKEQSQTHSNAGSGFEQAWRHELLQKLEAATENERESILQHYVCLLVGQVLGLDATFKLEPGQNLFELGMDSLMAVELRNQFHTLLDRPIPANLVFDHPNADALTAYLSLMMVSGLKGVIPHEK